jgi:5-methylcytosine-specific restriction endonuclease McrA
MTWDNRSEWDIDHIIPVAVFNFEKPEDMDFKRCWELKNLRPLWKNDNRRKGARLTAPFQPSLIF